jgi:hypothetical protein
MEAFWVLLSQQCSLYVLFYVLLPTFLSTLFRTKSNGWSLMAWQTLRTTLPVSRYGSYDSLIFKIPSALWSNNLLDTEKTMQSFFDSCAAAGPDGCPFYAPTADDISRNLTTLYNNLRTKPVPVRTKDSYGLVDYARLRLTIFTSLYKPFATFLPLAHGLADLAAGNGKLIFQLLETPPFQCSCDDRPPEVKVLGEAQTAILCNDGVDISEALDDFSEYVIDLTKKSTWGEIWGGIRAQCM